MSAKQNKQNMKPLLIVALVFGAVILAKLSLPGAPIAINAGSFSSASSFPIDSLPITHLSTSCSVGPLPYGESVKQFYSENGQDMFLLLQLFPSLSNGTFWEAGAYDGISGSNGAFFEREKNWSGVCVEPNKKLFNEVQRVRSCTAVNALICDEKSNFTYTQLSAPDDGLSGIWEFMPKFKQDMITDHINSGISEILEEYSLPCVSPKTLTEVLGSSHIDFFSLDVEGAEFEVISLIDDSVEIDVFTIEGNDKRVDALMTARGYILYQIVGYDSIWVRKNSAVHHHILARAACWQ